jgi:hypothetical protein
MPFTAGEAAVTGSPLLRASLLFAALLVLAVPLRQVTQPEGDGGPAPSAAPTPGEQADATLQKLPLVLSFTTMAGRIELRHLGRTVWSKDRPALREEVDLNLAFPREGIELGVTVQWPGGDLAALRMQLTTPDGTELDRSAWGAETMETVLSFP